MPMRLEKKSPCKVNLLLNILGQRADGFHELETVMQPVNCFDELAFERGGKTIQLTCDNRPCRLTPRISFTAPRRISCRRRKFPAA